jgi:uncharacterized protein GlcG (DUF336 family)
MLAAAGTGLALGLPSSAASLAAAPSKLPTVAFLPMRLAQKAAEAAIENCHEKSQAVAATVVDAEGVVIVQLRSDGTTTASLDASKGKAYAAAGFRTPTDVLTQFEPNNPGFLQVPGFVILGGGLPIPSGGKVVGGIGVGGAPSAAIDKTCAQAGLDAITGSL